MQGTSASGGLCGIGHSCGKDQRKAFYDMSKNEKAKNERR